MKPEVEEYFIDIPTLLSRQQKKLLQVYEFQRTHWKNFVSLHEKQEAMLEKTQKRSAELEREVALLREENNQLRRLLSDSKQHHTPGKNTAHSPGLALRRGASKVSPVPYSNSPYGMAVTSTPQQDGMYQRQPQVRTPAGPSRLTVRTPPSNGMIGTTRPSPYMHSQRPGSAGNTPGGLSQRLSCAGNTPGGLRTANTPGPNEPVTPSMLRAAMSQTNFSPMHASSPMISSQNRVTSWMSSSQRTTGSYVQRDSSPAGSQCGHSQSRKKFYNKRSHIGSCPVFSLPLPTI
ncbi:hypothetical protein AC249_AIPGENE27997 [Exaiptasia diaphana]|nr:hypothetical protein AC249_AIPGENE27997 [Exaiptasia diaphana]